MSFVYLFDNLQPCWINFFLFLLNRFLGIFRTENYYISSANRYSFISNFLICMPFISFSCLFAQARTSNTALNKSDESRYPCLVFDYREKTFSLLSISKISIVGVFLCVWLHLKIKLRRFPSVLAFLLFLITNGYWILSNACFWIEGSNHF